MSIHPKPRAELVPTSAEVMPSQYRVSTESSAEEARVSTGIKTSRRRKATGEATPGVFAKRKSGKATGATIGVWEIRKGDQEVSYPIPFRNFLINIVL